MLAYVTGGDRQEPTRKDFSDVRYEDEAFSVIDAARSTPNAIRGTVGE